MSAIQQLITEHMDIWTAADIGKRSGRGRASGNADIVYGVKKLRELILELAMRGKLVPQDANDEPASELLKRIQAEKFKLVAEGKTKKEKPLPPISEDEPPFALPNGWDWQRLPDTYYSISPKGRQLKGSEIKELGKYPVVDQGQSFISGYTDLTDLLIEIPHAIIVFGDHTTNIKLIDFNFVAGADGTKLLAPILIYPNFYYYYLQSYKLENRGYARHFKVLNDNLIAIPPIAEQQRIVAKVDELMALCNQLEAQHSNAAEAHENLVNHLLSTLTQSESADDFNANWQRISAYFDMLFTTEASIDVLKQTLLQLAVMGKLVPQDANDEPASELLKRIQAEKFKLVAEGKTKKEKPLPPISEDEKPFDLPRGWEWVQWIELTAINDAAFKRGPFGSSLRKDMFVSSGYKVYEQYCPINDDCSFERYFVTKEKFNSMKDFAVKANDFLISCSGVTLGRITQVPEAFNEGIINQALLRVRMNREFINSDFFKLLFRSPYFQKMIFENSTGSAIPNVKGVQELKKMAVPFLPITEQKRIVAKVHALMALCDQLKTLIQQASQQQQVVANVLVAQVLN